MFLFNGYDFLLQEFLKSSTQPVGIDYPEEKMLNRFNCYFKLQTPTHIP